MPFLKHHYVKSTRVALPPSGKVVKFDADGVSEEVDADTLKESTKIPGINEHTPVAGAPAPGTAVDEDEAPKEAPIPFAPGHDLANAEDTKEVDPLNFQVDPASGMPPLEPGESPAAYLLRLPISALAQEARELHIVVPDDINDENKKEVVVKILNAAGYPGEEQVAKATGMTDESGVHDLSKPEETAKAGADTSVTTVDGGANEEKPLDQQSGATPGGTLASPAGGESAADVTAAAKAPGNKGAKANPANTTTPASPEIPEGVVAPGPRTDGEGGQVTPDGPSGPSTTEMQAAAGVKVDASPSENPANEKGLTEGLKPGTKLG